MPSTDSTAPLFIRDAVRSDFDELLDLNEASVEQTSPLDHKKLEAMASQAGYFRVAEDERGHIAGFLIGFLRGASYESLNFRWFSERFEDFFYVDRVVVRSDQRKRGLGSRLYEDLKVWALDARVAFLACEVNLEPANEASLAFHVGQGFVTVGNLRHENGKHVSLLVRKLA